MSAFDEVLDSLLESSIKSTDSIKTHYCCDVVLEQDNKKYILGTNQLFPVYEQNFVNGGSFDVSLFVYTALKWKELFYTSDGVAISEDEDPDALLGYNHGIDIFSFKGSTPCLAKKHEEMPLSVDEWCRLVSNAIPAQPKDVLPVLWKKDPGGHEFWVPGEGMVRAIPVQDVPIALYPKEVFNTLIRYNLDAATLIVQLQSMLYKYMTDNSIDKLYIGYRNDLSAKPEEQLIDAYEWSNTHHRRIGAKPYQEDKLYSTLSISSACQLAQCINSTKFTKKEIFA